MRIFESGATRDDVDAKPDYRGFLSPLVLERFGRYMLKHRVQADGNVRDSDNWKRGIPKKEYLSSNLRHTLTIWLYEEGFAGITQEEAEEAACASFFNIQGYLLEHLKESLVGGPTGEPVISWDGKGYSHDSG